MSLICHLTLVLLLLLTVDIIEAPSSCNLMKNPYVVTLRKEDEKKHFCSGILLNPDFVLTVAHCVQGIEDPSEVIVQGMLALPDSTDEIDVLNIFILEDFNPKTLENGFSLLKLADEFPVISTFPRLASEDFTDEILSTVSKRKSEEMLIIGWKSSQPDAKEDTSMTTRCFKVYAENLQFCEKALHSSIESNSTICVGSDEDSKIPCDGDNGAPVLFNGVVLGLMVYGGNCKKMNQESLFIRVGEVFDLMKKELKGKFELEVEEETVDGLAVYYLKGDGKGGAKYYTLVVLLCVFSLSVIK